MELSLTGSGLRDLLSNVILKLNEDQVLLELYNKWWKIDDNQCKLADGDGQSNLKLSLQNLGKDLIRTKWAVIR